MRRISQAELEDRFEARVQNVNHIPMIPVDLSGLKTDQLWLLIQTSSHNQEPLLTELRKRGVFV